MRTERFERVLNSICGLAGWGALSEIDDIRRGKIIEFVNLRLQESWEGDWWPDFMRVDRRTYRDPWDVDATYVAEAEVFYDVGYYLCLVGHTGETPDTSPIYWELIDDIEDKYIPYQQINENSIGDVKGAYTRNPRATLSPGLLHYDMSENGCQLTELAPAQVYIEYRIWCSQFSNEEHDPEKSYMVGDVIYDPSIGECYRAVLSAAGVEMWGIVQFPWFMKNYIVRGTAADLLEDDGQHEKALAFGKKAAGILLDLQDAELDAEEVETEVY